MIGTVLYITAIGLYQLFVEEIQFPGWLRIDSTEELETNLIGVTVVVLAVNFMGCGWEQIMKQSYSRRIRVRKIVFLLPMVVLFALSMPLTLQAQAPVQCEEEYVVQVSDTLASIAEKTLNDPLAYPALLVLANAVPDDAYANIDDPNEIEEGWTLCIPSEEDLPDLLIEGGPVVEVIARSVGLEPSPPLEDTLWVLVGYGDPEDPTVVEVGTVVTDQFQEDGTLTGSGGCNNYSVNYEIDDDNNLTVRGPMAVTQRLCPSGSEQEAAYLEALQKAESYQITADGFLQIEYRTGPRRSETLFFVSGQAQLRNTQWVLQAFGDPEELQSVEPATTITAVFTGQADLDRGTIVGFGGCNSYSADYVVQDNRKAISGRWRRPNHTRSTAACLLSQAQKAPRWCSGANHVRLSQETLKDE